MQNAQVTVRNIDPRVVERLKSRAKRHGRSMAGEIRVILHEAAERSETKTHKTASEIAAQVRAQFAGMHFSDSTDMIRKDRDSR